MRCSTGPLAVAEDLFSHERRGYEIVLPLVML